MLSDNCRKALRLCNVALAHCDRMEPTRPGQVRVRSEQNILSGPTAPTRASSPQPSPPSIWLAPAQAPQPARFLILIFLLILILFPNPKSQTLTPTLSHPMGEGEDG